MFPHRIPCHFSLIKCERERVFMFKLLFLWLIHWRIIIIRQNDTIANIHAIHASRALTYKSKHLLSHIQLGTEWMDAKKQKKKKKNLHKKQFLRFIISKWWKEKDHFCFNATNVLSVLTHNTCSLSRNCNQLPEYNTHVIIIKKSELFSQGCNDENTFQPMDGKHIKLCTIAH